MTKTRKRGWRELVILLAALTCAGTWAAGQVRSIRDRSEVVKMTEKMKTVCVGRYLVDVPGEGEVRLSGARISGFAINTEDESEADFRNRVSGREAEILARRHDHDDGGEGGMVEARDLRIPGLIGRSLIYGRSRGYMMNGDHRIDMESVSIEVHAHMGDLSISLSGTSKQASNLKDAEALLARFQPRGAEEVPLVPGFCIWRGVFAEPLPEHNNEHVTLHLGLPGHPDMGLAFDSMPAGRSDRSLLARVADVDAAASPDEMLLVTKLRSGKRSINGVDGEEVLERVRELNFTTGYSFMWEALGVEEDNLRPYLLLNMETGTNPRPGGKPVDSSLHEDAVMALWDSISSSIRLRKTDAPPPADAPPEPPAPKLGAQVTAGDVCPHTGWWKCREGGHGVDVQGGAVQWIRKGDRMPQPLLLPRQTLWQKLRGLQPSIEPTRPTTWKLVDKRMRPRTPVVVALAQAGAVSAVPDEPANAGRSVALGTSVRTGDVCPASGWWRCEEALALDGTRWFPRGSSLPAATFQVESGMFGRSPAPEVIQRRSMWELVRHAEAEGVALLADAGREPKDDASPPPVGPSTLA